jgi:probable HAF family extracellular repeat protein
MRRGLLLGVIAVLALGAAEAARSGGPHWVIRELVFGNSRGSCRAVALNERGQIVINCYRGSDTRRAFLWQNGKLIELGTLPGDRNSEAVAINDSGQVAGNSDSGSIMIGVHGDTFVRTHAFVWQRGKLAALAAPSPRWKWSEATGLNENGQVIGVYSSQQAPFDTHAILWTRGRITNLGAGDRLYERSSTAAINDRGEAVGYLERPYADGSFAILWRAGAKLKIGPPPKRDARGGTGNAFAINNRGEVLGATGFGGSGAFLWTNGKTVTLRGLNVASINDRGQIVGTSGDFQHDRFHAHLWQDGKTSDLGTLAGARQSEAAAINNHGQVIGQSGDYVNAKQTEWSHAVLWQNGAITDLGVLPGGRASGAVAINNHNQIVGWSTTKGGHEHPALWELEPD